MVVLLNRLTSLVPKNLLRDKTKGELIKRLFLGGLDVKWQLLLLQAKNPQMQLPPIDSLLRLLAYAKVVFKMMPLVMFL